MDANSYLNYAGIYRIRIDRGLKPPKFYIGQASIFRTRRKSHFKALRGNKHENPALQKAFNKYGQQAFTFEIVLACEKRKQILTFYEQRLLDSYSRESIYNVHTACVDSPLGTKASEATRTKHSTARRGLKYSAEHCSAISASLKGHEITKAARAKISAALKGRKDSPEMCAKKRGRIPWNKGKPGPIPLAETCAKMSRARKGTKHTQAARKKMIGRVFSEETRAKLSKALKGRIFTPEHRAAISKARKGMLSEKQAKNLSEMSEKNRGRELSPEHRAAISNGRIEAFANRRNT